MTLKSEPDVLTPRSQAGAVAPVGPQHGWQGTCDAAGPAGVRDIARHTFAIADTFRYSARHHNIGIIAKVLAKVTPIN